MAITVTHAKDHQPTVALATYCTPNNVLDRIPGLNIGDDLEPLANLGATAQRDALIARLLPVAKLKVDRYAGGDFDYHNDVDIKLNGNGEDRLELEHFGFVPLLEVTSLVIDDSTMETDTYEWTSRGTIAYSGETITEATGLKTNLATGFFPKGEKNIELNVSWGYESVPVDVVYAAENFVVADLLFQLAAATANTADALAGGDVAISIGDLRVQPKTGWKYSSLAERLEKEAKGVLKTYKPRIRVQLVTPEPPLRASTRQWLRVY